MQDALKYISVIGMIDYCQVGKKFKKYYSGIIPIMSPKEVAARIYLNIYWLKKGVKKDIDEAIADFKEKLTMMNKNQIKRLGTICENDAFINAYVNTQFSSVFLTMDIDSITDLVLSGEETK